MKTFKIALILSFLTVFSSRLLASDWPTWRGPNLDGSSEAQDLFAQPIALELLWKRPLGTGYSSFSVVDGIAVTLFGDDENDHLVALDAGTGEELWRQALGPTYRGHDGSEDGPIGTPTIAGKTVFAISPRGHLVAVELTSGDLAWSVNLPQTLGAKAPFYGFSTSPVAFADLLLVQVGGSEGRSICAFDQKTGELRFQVGQDSVSHQLPLLLEIEGKTQFLSVTDTQLTGVDPVSGQVLWSHRHSQQPQYVPTYPQPVLVDAGHLLLTFEKHAELHEMVALDGEIFLGEIWRSTHLKGSEAVPIVLGKHLYGFNGNFLTCIVAESGAEAWKSREPGGRGLIRVDQTLIIFAPSGEVVLVEATPEAYREKGRLAVAESGGLTPPSFADGKIFVRNQQMAAALQVKARAPSQIQERPPENVSKPEFVPES